ncbi:MAG TPA: ATP-binding protein [Chthoniobacterales bacterium]|nr:ATP-binding protein [Chthoniobacterales bacterium]
MHWWVLGIVILAIVAGTAFLFRRVYVKPWRELEHLLTTIGRGQQPPTFLLGGTSHASRIGLALEQLLDRQRQLDRQVTKDAAEVRAVFAALTDGLLVVDSTQHISICNPAFEKLYGKSAIVAGTPLLDIIRDSDVIEPIRAALAELRPRIAEVLGPDRKRQLQVTAVPITGENGRAIGVVALFHDISRLKHADEIRRDFVANVSHELRTPLSIFHGNLETLLEAGDLDQNEARHIYGVMKRHSDRLNLLVNDLLSLARLESKEANLQLSEIDVRDFLEEVTRDWAKRFAGKNLRLELQVPDDFPFLRADERRLEEVVHNLLDNAVNYSHPNSRILILGSAPDQEIVLSVSDEGVGIAPADLPRIFERFYRADRARSRDLGGTGLGLSIVKHIAQLHGGRVEAESTIGQGTTIRVILPNRSSE